MVDVRTISEMKFALDNRDHDIRVSGGMSEYILYKYGKVLEEIPGERIYYATLDDLEDEGMFGPYAMQKLFIKGSFLRAATRLSAWRFHKNLKYYRIKSYRQGRLCLSLSGYRELMYGRKEDA